MNKLVVIEVDNNEWSTIINKCQNYDFYHTQAYNHLEKEHRPVLFTFQFEDQLIALPLIIRQIPNSDWFDCTSVYGYCGPISTMNIDEIPLKIITFFQKELLKYFDQNKIISIFSRLHPLISTGSFFTDFGTISSLNKTVAIDLKLNAEDQRKQYRKSNKSELNQLRRKGYQVKVADSKEDIDSFIAIYNETMERVDAKKEFFFDDSYFYNFLDNTSFETKLLLATFEGKIIAGAIFTITNKIMQYHLAGTTQEFIKVTPMKLILDEARLLGNELMLDYLHLGGGVGGSDEDSLFRFKAGFSDDQHQFKIWKMIHNENRYKELVLKNNCILDSNFFPLYRAILSHEKCIN